MQNVVKKGEDAPMVQSKLLLVFRYTDFYHDPRSWECILHQICKWMSCIIPVRGWLAKKKEIMPGLAAKKGNDQRDEDQTFVFKDLDFENHGSYKMQEVVTWQTLESSPKEA